MWILHMYSAIMLFTAQVPVPLLIIPNSLYVFFTDIVYRVAV